MRSVFVENLHVNKEMISLKTKEYHHLVNVVRLKVNEKVKLFNRKNDVVLTEVESIDKKNIIFIVREILKVEGCAISFSVAFGKLKKEAFDLSIKQLVEIGVNKIYIFESEFSQNYPIKKERLDKIIVSAMEQSNNFIYPQIIECSLESLFKTFKNIIYFSSNPANHQKIDTSNEESLVVIGPEGGLSVTEELQLKEKGAQAYHLPTNILRAQTAVSFCSGFVLGHQER